MTTSEKIPETWCRMWNDDPSLAHELITDDGRWWSGVGEAADSLVGPAATEAFIERWAVDVGSKFTPRTLVIDGDDRLAYTWDVTKRDGTVLTGADVCVLRDGKVALNWTLPAAERDHRPDPVGAGDASRTELEALAMAWLDAERLDLHHDLVVDVGRQTVGMTFASAGLGGIGVLVADVGTVSRAWTFRGNRAHII